MTFWQDARPIPSRPRGHRHPKIRSRRKVLGAVAVVVAAALVPVLVVGCDPVGRRSGSDGAGPDPRWRVVEPRWTRTLTDSPQELLVDARGAVAIGSHSITGLAVGSGRERWHATVEAPNPWGGLGARTVVVSTATGFVGLDRRSGAPRWTVATGETPAAVAVGRDRAGAELVVVTTDEGGLVALDTETGSTRWSLRVPGRVRGAPVIGAGAVAVVTSGAVVRLRAFDLDRGEARWEQEVAPQSATPVIDADVVLLGAGDGEHRSTLSAYGLADGAPRWRAPVPASFQPGFRPTIAGRSVFVLDQLAHVTRIERGTGVVRWTRALHGAALVGAPMVVGDAVVVADATRAVVTLDRTSGRVLTRRVATGTPVRLVRAGATVLLAQRLVARDQIAAYPAARVGTVRVPSAGARERASG